MSFFASNDRIYITQTDGHVMFDTNRQSPHFVGQITVPITISFPPAAGQGTFSIAPRAPPIPMYKYIDWTGTYYIGELPSGITNPFVYLNFSSSMSSEDVFTGSSVTAYSAKARFIGNGNYSMFQSALVEFRGSTDGSPYTYTYVATAGSNLYNHMARTFEVVIIGTSIYFNARQCSKTLYGAGGTTTSVGAALPNTGATYNLVITANIGGY